MRLHGTLHSVQFPVLQKGRWECPPSGCCSASLTSSYKKKKQIFQGRKKSSTKPPLPLATSICCHSLQLTWKVIWSRALRSPPSKIRRIAGWRQEKTFLPLSAFSPLLQFLTTLLFQWVSNSHKHCQSSSCTFDLETGVASEYWWHIRCWFTLAIAAQQQEEGESNLWHSDAG